MSAVIHALIRRTLYLTIGLLLCACGGSGLAPVVTRGGGPLGSRQAMTALEAGYHVVVRGDTVYSIAWRYGLDYRELARWNGIEAPYLIYPGRRLSLKPNGSGQAAQPMVTQSASAGSRTPPALLVRRPPSPQPVPQTARQEPSKQEPLAVTATPAWRPIPETPEPAPLKKETVAIQTPSKTAPAPSSGVFSRQIQWQWPATGQIRQSDSLLGKEGVAIHGEEGQPVKAAAPGEVVYSGDGLVGYGKLIIIKHNDTYLSAYAHNRKLLVKEGFRVAGGQAIAEMGNTGTKEVKLYFEIRRNGKPVPPLQYLPKQGL